MVPRNISSLAFMQGTFLFHRKYLVMLKHERTAVSYEIKNAPRGMRTSRRRGLLLRNTARARRVRKRTLCSLLENGRIFYKIKMYCAVPFTAFFRSLMGIIKIKERI